MPTRDIGRPHQLTRVRSLWAKDQPEDTRWRSSRGTTPHKKTSLAAQRTGGHRRVATRKTTGGYPATKGTDPETELIALTATSVFAPVVVDVASRAEVGTACTPCIPVGVHAADLAPPRSNARSQSRSGEELCT